MEKATDRIDVEGLAKLFGLPSWESIEESNIEFGAEAFAQLRLSRKTAKVRRWSRPSSAENA